MKLGIDIGQAILSDYESVSDGFAKLDNYHVQVCPKDFVDFPGPSRSYEHFRGLLHDERAFFLIAESETGQCLGFVNGYQSESPDLPMFKERRLIRVVNLYIDERARHQGIGTGLMKTVGQWGLDRGIKTIELDVVAGNSVALQFYEDFGFKIARYRLEFGRSDHQSTA